MMSTALRMTHHLERPQMQALCERERIRRRRYGVCIDCGQPIGFGLLNACPTAKRCMRCQAVHERTHAVAPHATL